MMDLLYLLKDTFKYLLLDLLIIGRDLREFALFIKMFFITKMKILEITLKRIMSEALTQAWLTLKYWGLPTNAFYGLEAYGTQ